MTQFCIFTRHGIVISYLYTIPWRNSLSKIRALRCLWLLFFIVSQPIRTTVSIRVQWKIQFSLSIFTKNKFCLHNQKSSVIGSIWCLWNQSNRSPTLSSDFVKGLCRGTITLYEDTALCKTDYCYNYQNNSDIREMITK